ncbi:phosphoribosyltransferase-like protein [Pseudomonas fluorescens]|uniref:phosphoribosyltransferase-like protein n=1 Tax=Pseudomonas fluorescens TaxID=294 RepID=UPI001BEB99C5|nr:hypothetical protein [Pseudomonas fluorescens]MBT2374404.1 hypothetical protein [Pseudomonas fluorescens]
MRFKPKKLTLDAIESSLHIDGWLSQFSEIDVITAKMMLSRLQFVSRDTYAGWLRSAVSNLPKGEQHAMYSVRKLPKNSSLWDEKGDIALRPGESQGSEDLVYSLISNSKRAIGESLFDHPSLKVLRKNKIHSIILIDDSIGSGDRVSNFINSMLRNTTFLSWWSYGLIRFHILSYARQRQAEKYIISKVCGSDHSKRTYPKSSKISFKSEVVYSQSHPQSRWGDNYEQILELCKKVTKVSSKYRLGYGEVMANLIFHHSVPNNIPGILWSDSKKWHALFPRRAISEWLPPLLDSKASHTSSQKNLVTPDIIRLLKLIKIGISSIDTLSERLTCDIPYAKALLSKAHRLKLVTDNNRLAWAGRNELRKDKANEKVTIWDTTMYIPSSWCAD